MIISQERREVLGTLEGLISEEVGLCLAGLAAQVPAGHAIVEIGSYKGKSTSYLAAGAIEGRGAPVYAIDPWDLPGNPGGRFGFNLGATVDHFRCQTMRAGVAHQITPFRSYSSDMARVWLRPIGLLYIDGSHTESDVRRDWELWRRHLGPGAVVVFDDYETERNPGVALVVDRISELAWTMTPRPLAIGRAA